jgi:serine/threonine protein kinase/Ca2+-binding EF-hand superfamily protein
MAAHFDASGDNMTLENFISSKGLKFDRNEIILTDEIARGGCGVVHGAIQKSTGQELALKFFGYTRNPPRIQWIEKEIRYLATVKSCPNAVQILGVFTDEPSGFLPRKIHQRSFPVIVMERLKGEDVFYRIVSTGKFSERNASEIFRSFITTVHHLHNEMGLINCDLKAENVVFQSRDTDDFRIKIIDFGTALSLNEGNDCIFDNVKRGTESLIAPETCNCHQRYQTFVYSKQTDIWQAGCFLYIILMASLPFGEGAEAERRISDINPTSHYLPPFFFSLSRDAQDVILRMLDKNPATRIGTEEILRHRWVRCTERVSNEDLGPEYRMRIRSWAYCKKLKKILAEKIAAGFERKLLLEKILLAASGFDSEQIASFLEMQQQMVAITPEDFRLLQQCFVYGCGGDANNHAVSMEVFSAIVERANFPFFAKNEVFEIFDQDNSKTVDYFEFLLTLIPFRLDAKDGDLAQLYFEVFDVDGNRSISQSELQWILSKLLGESDEGGSSVSVPSF